MEVSALSAHLSYLEALVVGLFQGVTELFPVSSLGHSILVPALIGGRWARDLNISAPDSPYLAVLVGLHVATAAALLVFFWRDWAAILGGLVSSLRHREIRTPAQRLGWLIVAATVPVGLAGLALDHLFRTTLGKPVPAALFLMINGLLLLAGERLRRNADPTGPGLNDMTSHAAAAGPLADSVDDQLAAQSLQQSILIGSAQILALLPGVSRSGIAMVAGLTRGLTHEAAARFSFLLATPVILAAGLFKIPDLLGPHGHGLGGQVLAGSCASFVSAYLAVRFLTRYFENRTLTPFAIYCLIFGGLSLAWLTLRR